MGRRKGKRKERIRQMIIGGNGHGGPVITGGDPEDTYGYEWCWCCQGVFATVDHILINDVPMCMDCHAGRCDEMSRQKNGPGEHDPKQLYQVEHVCYEPTCTFRQMTWMDRKKVLRAVNNKYERKCGACKNLGTMDIEIEPADARPVIVGKGKGKEEKEEVEVVEEYPLPIPLKVEEKKDEGVVLQETKAGG